MENQNSEYDDIINLPHHQSDTRHHMSLHDRAAQFAPFAALVGYDEMVEEEARLTDDRIEADENEKDLLEQKVAQLLELTAAGEHPLVTFTVFFEDKYKDGGHYESVTGRIKKIDLTMRRILIWVNEFKKEKPVEIPADDIIDIEILKGASE